MIKELYAGGTRGARVLNLVISIAWLIAIILDSLGFEVEIPNEFAKTDPHISVLIVLNILVAIASLLRIKFREIAKYVSLHLGALFHALIAAYLTLESPPLDMMVITSTLFSLWLLGAAYFSMSECKDCRMYIKSSDGH